MAPGEARSDHSGLAGDTRSGNLTLAIAERGTRRPRETKLRRPRFPTLEKRLVCGDRRRGTAGTTATGLGTDLLPRGQPPASASAGAFPRSHDNLDESIIISVFQMRSKTETREPGGAAQGHTFTERDIHPMLAAGIGALPGGPGRARDQGRAQVPPLPFPSFVTSDEALVLSGPSPPPPPAVGVIGPASVQELETTYRGCINAKGSNQCPLSPDLPAHAWF